VPISDALPLDADRPASRSGH